MGSHKKFAARVALDRSRRDEKKKQLRIENGTDMPEDEYHHHVKEAQEKKLARVIELAKRLR
jgi:hypothetical protein